jgi:NTE family protein
MYRGIALEGGGVLGTAYSGVIDVLDELKILPELTHFAGSSAGAIVAGLLACKLKSSDIKYILMNLDYTKFRDGSWILPANLYNLINYYGWYRGEIIKSMFEDILEKYVGDRKITFKGVKDKYGTTLITTTTDIGTRMTIYRTPENSSDVMIADAIHESASYPLIYPPIKGMNTIYVDGGMLNNYPIRKLYDYIPSKQVIGCKLVSGIDTNKCLNAVPKIPTNLLEYVELLIEILHEQNIKVHVEDEDWERTIKINVGTISSTNFKIDTLERDQLIEAGREAANKFFKK